MQGVLDYLLDDLQSAHAAGYAQRALLSIAGTTATGKTDLALALAEAILSEKVNGVRVTADDTELHSKFSFNFSEVAIIAADSRQIYEAIPIVSGADVPPDFERVNYYGENCKNGENGEISAVSEILPQESTKSKRDSDTTVCFAHPTMPIRLYGLSCMPFHAAWSVAHFQDFAWKIMRETWSRGGFVIIVGGTGLYHRHLLNAGLKLGAKPDQIVREQLAQLSLAALQTKVKSDYPQKWQMMTMSDQANPRRLIRVLEDRKLKVMEESGMIASSDCAVDPAVDSGVVSADDLVPDPDWHRTVLLTMERDTLEPIIRKRIQHRLEQGAIAEVTALLSMVDSNSNSIRDLAIFSATGVKEIMLYFQEKVSYEEMIDRWVRRELRYAKQQRTWWKKQAALAERMVDRSPLVSNPAVWYTIFTQLDHGSRYLGRNTREESPDSRTQGAN